MAAMLHRFRHAPPSSPVERAGATGATHMKEARAAVGWDEYLSGTLELRQAVRMISSDCES